MSRAKIKFRDVYYGLQKFRDFLLGRKYTLHNRFPPFLAPRSIPAPDIPKSSVVKYSDNYYAQRHAFDSVKPPVVAPVAEGATTKKCGKVQFICFSGAPTPGQPWWWDGHSYYEDDGQSKNKKRSTAGCPPKNNTKS